MRIWDIMFTQQTNNVLFQIGLALLKQSAQEYINVNRNKRRIRLKEQIKMKLKLRHLTKTTVKATAKKDEVCETTEESEDVCEEDVSLFHMIQRSGTLTHFNSLDLDITILLTLFVCIIRRLLHSCVRVYHPT